MPPYPVAGIRQPRLRVLRQVVRGELGQKTLTQFRRVLPGGRAGREQLEHVGRQTQAVVQMRVPIQVQHGAATVGAEARRATVDRVGAQPHGGTKLTSPSLKEAGDAAGYCGAHIGCTLPGPMLRQLRPDTAVSGLAVATGTGLDAGATGAPLAGRSTGTPGCWLTSEGADKREAPSPTPTALGLAIVTLVTLDPEIDVAPPQAARHRTAARPATPFLTDGYNAGRRPPSRVAAAVSSRRP